MALAAPVARKSYLCYNGELEIFMLILLDTLTTKPPCTHLISTSPAAKKISPYPHIIRLHLMAYLAILAPSVK